MDQNNSLNQIPNPYAAPAAPLEVAAPIGHAAEAPFFAVGGLKLAVMSLVTMGFYEVYWMYKHWRAIRDREGISIMPVLRAIFAIFFIHSLFVRFRDYEIDGAPGPAAGLAAGGLAVGWIIFSLLWKLPGPGWAASMVTFAFLLPAQAAANRVIAAAAPAAPRNERFTAWNWVGIVLGTPMLLSALYGTLTGV